MCQGVLSTGYVLAHPSLGKELEKLESVTEGQPAEVIRDPSRLGSKLGRKKEQHKNQLVTDIILKVIRKAELGPRSVLHIIDTLMPIQHDAGLDVEEKS